MLKKMKNTKAEIFKKLDQLLEERAQKEPQIPIKNPGKKPIFKGKKPPIKTSK